jgi:chemotaxis protein methyltransferase CheR
MTKTICCGLGEETLVQVKNDSIQEFMEQMALQKIKRMIHENVGLNCSGYRDEYLKRRFEVRLRATGSNSYGRYIVYLRNNPDEFKNLLNDLTINYTMFFRDTDVYTYLEKTLLPKIFQASKPTRIWSAGCATGEEPYSLAIIVHKVLKQAITSHPLVIYASDIDKDALYTGIKGEYSQKQLTNLDSNSIEKFFTREGENYKISSSVKQLVRFHEFDLMNSPVHQNLDLILCRNVMIYFSKEGQQRIHMNFYKALKEGSYFITGKSEMLSGEPALKFVPIDQQVRVYQKPLNQTRSINDISIETHSQLKV